MFEPIFDFFERLISDFSWRRLVFVLVVSGVAAGLVVTYEGYTKSFKLARLDKEISLLHRLEKLSASQNIPSDARLRSVYIGIADELAANVRSVSSTTLLVPMWFRKAVTASIPWFFLAVAMWLADSPKNKKFESSTAIGLVIAALPFVILSVFLPYFGPLINYFVYPAAHCIIIVLLITAWHNRRRKVDERGL